MKYRKDYQETHDIDWFFCFRGRAYHAASNGGRLPDAVDSANNRQLQSLIEQMDGEFEIEDSDNLYLYVGHDETDNHNVNYGDISSFQIYAAKGFISIDRTEGLNDNDRPTYHRVAYPRNGGSVTDQNILALLPELSDADIVIEYNE